MKIKSHPIYHVSLNISGILSPPLPKDLQFVLTTQLELLQESSDAVTTSIITRLCSQGSVFIPSSQYISGCRPPISSLAPLDYELLKGWVRYYRYPQHIAI